MTQLVGPDVISLSALDDASAANLFKSSLIESGLTADAKAMIELIHYLCGLSLAPLQAARFINENSLSLKSYLSILHQQILAGGRDVQYVLI